MNRQLKCRICKECNGIMLQSMCISGCEYVCFICESGEPFFCDNEEIYLSEHEHNVLMDFYKNTYSRLAFTRGGATCGKCDSSKGNNCKYCSWECDEILMEACKK